MQVSLIYPEGFLFTYATNFGNGNGSRSMIYGTEGVIDFSGKPVVWGSGAFGKSQIEQETAVEPASGRPPSRSQPKATPVAEGVGLPPAVAALFLAVRLVPLGSEPERALDAPAIPGNRGGQERF